MMTLHSDELKDPQEFEEFSYREKDTNELFEVLCSNHLKGSGAWPELRSG